MKVNHITDATKILLLAATTVITCVIVWLGNSALITAREMNENAISQMADLNNDLKDNGIKMYDGAQVTGSEVVNCIKKYLGDFTEPEQAPIYVNVIKDSIDATYYNNKYFKNIRDFTDDDYIKPTSTFTGKVLKNTNDIIIGIIFTQR
ncbi:MAG TPA: hypothetical protein VN131_00610 [Mobilitalea sp.]|nr:hypothetical protein [Mobilitalea sp.]